MLAEIWGPLGVTGSGTDDLGGWTVPGGLAKSPATAQAVLELAVYTRLTSELKTASRALGLKACTITAFVF